MSARFRFNLYTRSIRPTVNIISIKPNGPLIARGKIRVENSQGVLLIEDKEVFLCRCGESGNKPFCDGAHKSTGFTDPAQFHDEKTEAASGDDSLTITVRENAMLIAKGPMHITSLDESCQTTRNKAAFCRCGHSDNKPFCDTSHKRCGFTAADLT